MRSKKYIQFVIIFSFLLLACNPAVKTSGELPEGELTERLAYIEDSGNYASEADRLNDLYTTYIDWLYKSSPITATFMGKSEYNDLWNDVSPEGTAKNIEQIKQLYEARNWFDREALEEDDKMNYDIFVRTLESFYDLNANYPEQYLIIDQQGGVHIFIPSVIQMMPRSSEKDYQNILTRLKGISILYEGITTTLKEGIEKGIVMPKNTLAQVPAQLKSLLNENAEQSIFYMPFSDIPETSGIDKPEALQEQAREVITDVVNPAIQSFLDFMENEYIPNSRETYGLSELPNGKEWYNERIKNNTTTNMTAEEIHELGKSEVARITKEMLAITTALNFNGDLAAFNDFLRTDPQFFFDTPEELLAAYRDICKRIDPEVVKLFGHLPKLPYGVKEVPAYRAQSATTAYYNPGSMQTGTPGYFFANTSNLKSRPKWEMEALSIHEAVPGHHLQIAIAQELENVPEFRTTSTFTAFVEGWGLYSESLGPELGMYTDPYSKYGQLTYEMWRAIRLVVDTGIHAMGWTRAEAIDYFKANSGKSEHDITVEIDRYIAWPGQALAYKIGELKIKELKQRAKDALGDRFDIRAFHDEVLRDGAVTLDILEAKIDQWIASQSEAQQ